MLKTILIVLAVAILALLAYAATRPDSFRVERSTTIQAPPEKIYAHLQDFNRWVAWSPWEKMDAAMKKTYGGAATGKGATYAWSSDKVGAGSMEILDTTPPQALKIKLDFSKPFEAHNLVDFTLQPQGANGNGGTLVTWAMHGPSNYMTKLVHIFMDMDKIVGKDFAAGLQDLKAVSEK
jgi:uncharacterized protein YndB with AHSA1/START domain